MFLTVCFTHKWDCSSLIGKKNRPQLINPAQWEGVFMWEPAETWQRLITGRGGGPVSPPGPTRPKVLNQEAPCHLSLERALRLQPGTMFPFYHGELRVREASPVLALMVKLPEVSRGFQMMTSVGPFIGSISLHPRSSVLQWCARETRVTSSRLWNSRQKEKEGKSYFLPSIFFRIKIKSFLNAHCSRKNLW